MVLCLQPVALNGDREVLFGAFGIGSWKEMVSDGDSCCLGLVPGSSVVLMLAFHVF